jgi:inosine-uridine nucleoside N-ribohydrolase
MKKRTVILDTDIGTDIDDSWALAFLLNSPKLDLKLITTATGDTQYRAVVAERILDAAGRTDIPIAVGKPTQGMELALWNYVKDDPRLGHKKYPDAVQAIVDLVNNSDEPITLLSIAPLPNIAELLTREPAIASKIDLIGMLGSVYVKYDGTPGCDPEYNVVKYLKASQQVFGEKRWRSFKITPIDTCGSVKLTQAQFLELEKAGPMMKEVIASNRVWTGWDCFHGELPPTTSTMFDTVAVYMAFSTEWLEMKKLRLCCDDRGCLVEHPDGAIVDTAIRWKDKEKFLDLLMRRLRVQSR